MVSHLPRRHAKAPAVARRHANPPSPLWRLRAFGAWGRSGRTLSASKRFRLSAGLHEPRRRHTTPHERTAQRADRAKRV
jgi:hypothetical protein